MKTPPSVYDTGKNQDRVPSRHAHQDAEESAIYLYRKDEAEETQEPKAPQLALLGGDSIETRSQILQRRVVIRRAPIRFMIPRAAPTWRREPVGDEATITPRRANHDLRRKDSKEATSTALTADSYDPA